MAKKGKTGNIGLFGFVAMIINAIAWLLTALNLFSEVAGILMAVGNIILTLIVIYVAYDFAKKQTKGWKIVFWVLATVSILAILFGCGVNFAQ